jgi:hypothetical protein
VHLKKTQLCQSLQTAAKEPSAMSPRFDYPNGFMFAFREINVTKTLIRSCRMEEEKNFKQDIRRQTAKGANWGETRLRNKVRHSPCHQCHLCFFRYHITMTFIIKLFGSFVVCRISRRTIRDSINLIFSRVFPPCLFFNVSRGVGLKLAFMLFSTRARQTFAF